MVVTRCRATGSRAFPCLCSREFICSIAHETAGVQEMFKTLMALTTLSLLIFNSSNASAQGRTFQLVSQASNRCVSLKSPDQNDGGGLVMQNCQNFPDFYITATSVSDANLQFQLSSHRFVCIFATE